MIRLNMRDFFDEKSDFIDFDSIRNTLAAAGHPLLELVDDMEMLKKTLNDSSSHETSHTALTDRLRDGWFIDLFIGHRKGVDPDITNNTKYTSTWVNSRFTIAFCKPRPTYSGKMIKIPAVECIAKLRDVVDAELGEGAFYNMLPWVNPDITNPEQQKWTNDKVSLEVGEYNLPRKDLKDVERLDEHYAEWIANFVSYQLAEVLPWLEVNVLSARMLEALTGVSHRVRWMSSRLHAYERTFGCADMTLEELQGRERHPVADDGVGNRSKAQFDEPDEPSLFQEGDDEILNPLWVLYTTNYHRGLLTQEQVVNVGNNLLKQLQQCSKERLQEIGPRGIPNVLTKFGHVSMAWVMHFKNAHQPDLNFGQITRLGHTVAEQVKAYKPRG